MHSPPKVNPPIPFSAEGIRAQALRADPNSTMTVAEAQAIAEQKTTDALDTFTLLQEAVKLIDSKHAWPIDVSKYRIDILDGVDIVTTSFPGRFLDPESAVYDGSKLRIEFGLDAIKSPSLQYLIGNNATLQQACTFLLCHEIFHLTEIKRQKECGFFANAAKSGFAKGIRPEMNSQWQSAIHDLTREYWKKMTMEKKKADPRDPLLATDEAIAAADMVSEACADLQALAIYERIYGLNARIAFQANLITQRIADENAGGVNYKIGQELAAILPNLQELSNHNIVVATWQSAKNKIAIAADADAQLKAVVANINLTFDRPLQELPTKKSMLAKGFRLIGF